MSRNSSHRYSFQRHSFALYATLEAAVRGDTFSAEPNKTLGSDTDPEGYGDATKTYTSPFLWYEDMTPADIDAYHAGHRCAAGGRSAPATDSLERRSTSYGHKFRVNDHPTCGEGLPAVAAKKRRTATDDERMPAPDARDASPPFQSAGTNFICVSEPPREDAINPGRRHSELSAVTAMPEPFLPAETVLPPEEASFASLAVVQHDMSRKEQQEEEAMSRPFGLAKPSSARRGQQLAATATTTTMTTAATARAVTDPRTHAHDRNGFSEIRYSATAAAPTEASQATQTTFLPDLPSQVLVTQQVGDGGDDDDGCWEQGYAEHQETEASEYSYSLSLPPESRRHGGVETNPTWRETESVGEKRAFDDDVPVSSGRDTEDSKFSKLQRGEDGGGDDDGDHAVRGRDVRARQYEDFIRSLPEFVGHEHGRRVETKSAGSDERSDYHRGDQQARQPFTFVPTHEVLPSGWPRGQTGVVAVLEGHLSRAQEKSPNGYASRALELACHVLRQPMVCVRAESVGGGVAHVLRQVGAPEALPDDHPEVVGVAGLVWKILRAGGG